MKYLLSILTFCVGTYAKSQGIYLYPDSFYRYEFSSVKEMDKSINSVEIKAPSKWEYASVVFKFNGEDSNIYFVKGSQEFSQKLIEEITYIPFFRGKKKVHRYYITKNPCGDTSIFADVPSGKNKRVFIYYHVKSHLKFEAVYFPYEVRMMEALARRMEEE
jgi:hypothetical protein